jgi:DNA-binding MarR family transcriptional regulator/GNAT superfamily N-acetyltransferase
MNRRAIAQVRHFNRAVASRIGALDDRFLGRPRSIGESRLLWEIGAKGAEVRALRARLGLDSGYISRVLGALARQKLIVVRVSRSDRRVRRATLTASGRAEFSLLDRRSDEVASGILEPLSARQRETLVDAMAQVERLLQVSLVRFATENPAAPDSRWCLAQYFAELDARFDRGFNPKRSISADPHELTPPAGRLVIARLHERPIGCGALKLHRGAPAELKRMWIAPDARGLGIGHRLLQELERHAREAGATLVRLETNRTLTEAIALYRRCGYVEVTAFNDEPYAHHWFQKRLSGRSG